MHDHVHVHVQGVVCFVGLALVAHIRLIAFEPVFSNIRWEGFNVHRIDMLVVVLLVIMVLGPLYYVSHSGIWALLAFGVLSLELHVIGWLVTLVGCFKLRVSSVIL